MNTTINFFKGLFNADGTVSSKRVAGMEVLQVVLIMVIGNQFTKYKLDMAVLITLLGFVVSCFGMNTFLSAKSMAVKETVASDIVKTEALAANEDAKDVLNSNQP